MEFIKFIMSFIKQTKTNEMVFQKEDSEIKDENIVNDKDENITVLDKQSELKEILKQKLLLKKELLKEKQSHTHIVNEEELFDPDKKYTAEEIMEIIKIHKKKDWEAFSFEQYFFGEYSKEIIYMLIEQDMLFSNKNELVDYVFTSLKNLENLEKVKNYIKEQSKIYYSCIEDKKELCYSNIYNFHRCYYEGVEYGFSNFDYEDYFYSNILDFVARNVNDFELRKSIALNVRTSIKTLEFLIHLEDKSLNLIKFSIIKRSGVWLCNFSTETQEYLKSFQNEDILYDVLIISRFIDFELLVKTMEKLSEKHQQAICKILLNDVLYYYGLEEKQLHLLSIYVKGSYYINRFLEHDNITNEIIDNLSISQHWNKRYWVANSSKTSLDTLLFLCQDKDSRVRKMALNNSKVVEYLKTQEC